MRGHPLAAVFWCDQLRISLFPQEDPLACPGMSEVLGRLREVEERLAQDPAAGRSGVVGGCGCAVS